MGEYEDLQKTKEEQDERLENMKFKNKELEENKDQLENDIMKQSDNITRVTKQINDTKSKIEDKNTEKKNMDDDTE
jgi:hypothetical protein